MNSRSTPAGFGFADYVPDPILLAPMKRLVWLLLAVLAPVLVQVQPVVLSAPRHQACCCNCGDCNGACGMPGCLPPPASSSTLPVSAQPAKLAAAGLRRVGQPVARECQRFFAAFVASAVVPVAMRSPARVAAPAGVPLFKAHCSLLV
jgi:hypothetical protein